jgi:hypothetical protein
MKILITVAVFALAILSASAQGVIALKNVGSGANGSVNAPLFTDDSLTVRLTGTAFSAQLWAGPDLNSLTAVGPVVNFGTGVLAGYFSSTPNVTVPTVNAGSVAAVQIRAWDNAGGTITSWDSALTRGESNILNIGLVDSLNPNVNTLVGLQSFGLTVVPEPSVVVLGLLGGSALLLRRRKK